MSHSNPLLQAWLVLVGEIYDIENIKLFFKQMLISQSGTAQMTRIVLYGLQATEICEKNRAVILYTEETRTNGEYFVHKTLFNGLKPYTKV